MLLESMGLIIFILCSETDPLPLGRSTRQDGRPVMAPLQTVNACSTGTAFTLEGMEDDEPMVFYTFDYAGSTWPSNATDFIGVQ